MAVIPWTQVTNTQEGSAGRVYRFGGMNANDCGQALAVLPYADNTWQIFATGPITMRGSLKKAGKVGDADVANPTTADDWMTLTDYDGTLATLTTAGNGQSLKQNVVALSPLAGGGVVSVDVYVLIGSSR